MTMLAKIVTAAAAVGIAAPAAAQYQSYPQPYAQPYPQSYAQTYPYQQGYGANPIGQVIDQLLGNRYNVTDRQAVGRCASAAMTQAQAQYGARGYGGGYGGAYNQQQYGGYGGNFRVTSITDVQRRQNGLRVTGMLGSDRGYGNHGYGNQGYGNGGYGDLSFRCNVDYRGAVTGLRVRPAG
jgi:hypothetical protein